MNGENTLPTLRWQFQLTWRLAEVHLPALTDEACLWEPAPGSWTVRKSTDGKWRPDWVIPEPEPPPPVTIGWLTWHLLWWWSGLQSAMRHELPPAQHQIFWSGSAAAVVLELLTLSAAWDRMLTEMDASVLEKPLAYPWQEARPLRIALAWANSELMKNIAEIGIIHHLFIRSVR